MTEPKTPADAWRRLRDAVLPNARFALPAQVRYGKTEALLGKLLEKHADHVITVRAPSYRVDGTGPAAGYLFCRECDGDVALNNTPHTVSDRRHEWWQDSCYCTCSRCSEQGDHFVGSCSIYSDDDSTAAILRSVIKAAANLYDALGVAAADMNEIADCLDPIENRRPYHLAQLGQDNAKKALDRHRMGSERCQCDIVGDNMPGCPVHR